MESRVNDSRVSPEQDVHFGLRQRTRKLWNRSAENWELHASGKRLHPELAENS